MPIVHSDRFFHPWHSLPIGENAPERVQSIIEIQQGSKAKYELDKLTGFLRLDRVLASNLSYPFHYGFIPQTYGQDNDPLDILILCMENLLPLSIVEATILGGIKMIDDKHQDDKIIAVATYDPFMNHKKELADINPEVLNTIKQFFQEYKKPENKEVEVQGFMQRSEALECIQKSIERYKKAFPKDH
jgi:inorganic pyrophosphatase